MKSNSLININELKNNEHNEKLFSKMNISNILYNKKRKLPKLNVANLSNSIDNFQKLKKKE